MLVVGGAFAGSIFLLISKQIKNDYPLYFRIFITSFMGSVMLGAMSIIFEGSTLTFNPETGVFGMFTAQ